MNDTTDSLQRARDNGVALLEQGKFRAAHEQFTRIVEANPSDVGARQKLAQALVQQGRLSEAVEQYSLACTTYAAARKPLQALAMCKVILLLDPEHKATQARIAKLYAWTNTTPENGTSTSTSDEPPVIMGKLFDVAPIDPWFFNASFESEEETTAKAAPEEEIIVGVELIEDAPTTAPAKSTAPTIPLFSSLRPEEFVAVLEGAVTVKAYDAGENIVVEGALSDAMYAVVEGTLAVVREMDGGKTVATLTAGDVFGEVGLMTNSPRLATVRAESNVVVLRFERAAMNAVLRRFPAVRPVLDTFYRDHLLANWLRANPLFAELDEPSRAALKTMFTAQSMKPGQVMVQAGQAGEAVFMLLRGACEVFDPSGQKYPDLREGDSFGEISVIRGIPATATVRAKTAGLVLRIAKDDVLKGAFEHPAVKPIVTRIINERLQRTAQLTGRLGRI